MTQFYGWGYQITTGEMDSVRKKHLCSHRGIAFRKLADAHKALFLRLGQSKNLILSFSAYFL